MASPPSLFPLPAEALGPLKTYLVDQLAPISDADSSLLSDYTVALLKAAEASDAEVEDEVKTQLRDFLDHSAPPSSTLAPSRSTADAPVLAAQIPMLLSRRSLKLFAQSRTCRPARA